MTTILGLSGSLRNGSFNSGLLRAAAKEMPEGSELSIGSISGVPLYDADLEAKGTPEPVLKLRDQLAEVDGLLLVTPEYNGGIPGVFKNALDWIGSGDGAKLFDGKPVAVIGASPMGFGTLSAQTAWLPILRALKCRQWHGGRLTVSGARKLFDAEGNLTDDETRDKLAAYLADFVASL